MPRLASISGFLPFLTVLFLNACLGPGHAVILHRAIFETYEGQDQLVLTAIVNGLLLIPFVALVSPAGFLADKYPKHLVIRWSALAALGTTLLITLCYTMGWFWGALALTLALGGQSAIYSPAKYGLIKELAGVENLAEANGLVLAVTIASISMGVLAFSGACDALLPPAPYRADLPADFLRRVAPLGGILVALSVTAWLLAFRLHSAQRVRRERRFHPRTYLRLGYLRQCLAGLREREQILQSVVGLTIFWTISLALFTGFPAFARESLDIADRPAILGLLACFGIGVAVGALIACRVSHNYIESSLIPVGAFGTALLIALLPALGSSLSAGIVLLTLGVSGGLFTVPLNALIQFHAREDRLGTVLAGSHWIQTLVMLSFLALAVSFSLAGIRAEGLLFILTATALLGIVYIIRQLPWSTARILASAVLRRRHKLQVLGFENLPQAGPVLLLGNHISWIDWALVQIACPRPIRFVMQRRLYDLWLLKPLFNLFRVVPISTAQARESMEAIHAFLKAGEVVCLFPEGTISGNGQLGKFHRGYERAVEGLEDGVIVPFYLRGLWGSKVSYADDRLRDSRAPSLPRDIIVAFGRPLPLDTPADRLKQKVFDLSITAWEAYTRRLNPLPLAWLYRVKRDPGDVCTVDATGVKLSRRRFATAVLTFAGAMKLDAEAKNVGLLLPAANAAAVANMAAMLKGRTVVNLNFSAPPEAVRAAIRKARIKQVFTSREFETRLEARGIDLRAMLDAVDVRYMETIRDRIPRWRLFWNLVQVSTLPARLLYLLHGRTSSLESPAAILFSSGSEGEPKGVVLSHRNIQSNCKQISDVLNTRVDDVVMASLPPFHAFGLTVTLIMPLIEGIPIVCHPDPTDVLGIARAVARYRATILFGTATFLSLYARNRKVEPILLESLRVVVAGAEKLPHYVREEFQKKFNKYILEGYGATETTPVASVNIPDAVDTGTWRVQVGQREGSVGMPLPGTSFKIVDPETRSELPLGEDGMICISGNQVMLGYLEDDEKTGEVIFEQDGMRWYETGDKGHLTSEGFLVVVDRYSRFAKIAGEMVSLAAVEELARQMLPPDSDVDLAAAAIPDRRKGEKIVMLVTSKAIEQALRAKMIAAGVNPMMIPARVIRVDAIPRLGSGKTDFNALNALAAETAAA